MTETYDLTNPNKPTIDKDPNATLDYSESWAAWLALAQDTLLSASVLADAPLVVMGPPTIANGIVTAILSGGTAGQTHRVTFTIVTASRTDQRSIYLRMRER